MNHHFQNAWVAKLPWIQSMVGVKLEGASSEMKSIQQN
jgi:hypothetical protein